MNNRSPYNEGSLQCKRQDSSLFRMTIALGNGESLTRHTAILNAMAACKRKAVTKILLE